METHFEKDNRKRSVKNAGTRLYAPSKNELIKAAHLDTESDEMPSDEESTAIPKRIEAKKEMSTAGRIGIMACAFVFAGMLLFVLSGYERISRAYADINTLNNKIEEVELHISALNVSIECAVTIEDAEQAALNAGMVYPSQSQIFSSGQTIPAPNSGNAGVISGNTDSNSDENAAENSENDAETIPDEEEPADTENEEE